jgi:alpha-tubulin suppressor-like RCC1 family protein
VYCWGANDDAQLGNLVRSPKARPVFANVTRAVQLALGVDHSCARLRDGTVQCWGDGGDGQLGDDMMRPFSAPVQVLGLSDVRAIAAGEDFTCAVTGSGDAFCWGYDGSGELGDAVAGSGGPPYPRPKQVSGIAMATMIAAGHHHACAGSALGLKCWGEGREGQLGDNGTTPISPPVAVVGAGSGAMWTPATLAAGADHTCAVDAVRRLRCWGDNNSGELGDGSFDEKRIPTAVALALSTNVLDVSTGDDGTCAQTSDGPMCWGENYYGQVGDGSTVFQGAPVAVKLSGNTVFPMAGGGHACAVASGQVLCWGDNASGQLGIGTFSLSLVPVGVVFP